MKCLKSDENSCILCAEFLKQEKIVLIPTDTVYGFSGIVGKTDEKIRKIKERSETKPFIQLISKKEDLNLITDEKVPEELLKFWPGPLTLIVKEKKQEPKKNSSVTIEILAGTWTGEKNISKIVILRGGRGFIIFTNGASMNINVSIDENSFIHIKQTSSSNASFYPELPRKNALEIAPFAKPIEWILQYNDDDSLSGIKNTITLNQNQDPVQTEIKVLWARKSPF